MIDWIEIRNFAIADQVELTFTEGFTTITGETGSGKSLMIDALAILLGARSDNSWIRHGAEQAEIQAGMNLHKDHAAHKWLKQHQLEDEGECLLRRLLRRDKASRGYINGHAVNATQLRELGSLLVDIHGQHEHHSLMNRQTQQQLLDEAAGNADLLQELSKHYDQLQIIRQQLDEVNAKSSQTQERTDLLTFQLQELDVLQPTDSEWSGLDSQHKRLQHLQEIVMGTGQVFDQLGERDNSVSSNLNQAISRLDQLSRLDASLTDIVKMLKEAEINISEATQVLRQFTDANNLEPEEIARIEKRFSAFMELSRKHRVAPETLGQTWQQMQQELDGLRNPDAELERLQKLLDSVTVSYNRAAEKITKNRKRQSGVLSKQITEAMQSLGMQGGQFNILLSPLEDSQERRFGREQVQFQVTANAGQPLQALSKVASGGELSRISLAIQVILANKTTVSCLIFDEVDIGVGGSVAAIVGQKLKQLGTDRQVICITHLAQVAAQGDDHLMVNKSGESSVSVNITRLDQKQRIAEIARMSGGETITPESLAHAQQLLGAA